MRKITAFTLVACTFAMAQVSPPTPGSARARAAGATPGTAYTDGKSLQNLVRLQPHGKAISLQLGDQEMTVFTGQRRAFSNGDPVVLPGAPFVLEGRSYYPTGLLRAMGCSVEAAGRTPGLKDVLSVTCHVDGKLKKLLFKKLIF
ncbi:stalk domain-containing protein [Deinococcus hopiensis]|uniref:Copper amine oxidase-like N-terminal domain-containing protein n=1 Tax=Deinococcus hopiensis KR-140 TaxID=695939 RepID=A0A1W1VII2_9DEIO|nr:stalk domain-containing protein [Deinococcus hopiensis]SMB93128.1 hypothetical protein SAMN00790413_01857 [Deinococcus hopiensis KR-140]